jgi:hypothetical protein|eukprot:COSAG01_NODE_1422_length_10360_cov_36.853815_12_plen_99_part_00
MTPARSKYFRNSSFFDSELCCVEPPQHTACQPQSVSIPGTPGLAVVGPFARRCGARIGTGVRHKVRTVYVDMGTSVVYFRLPGNCPATLLISYLPVRT